MLYKGKANRVNRMEKMAKCKLTQKEEGFCLSVVEQKTLAQSYRDNYDTSNMTDKSVWELASRQMAKVKVASRVAELQMAAQERLNVTVESISKELDENRALALSESQAAAATSASMGKAKLFGLLVDKVDGNVKHGLSDDLAAILAGAMNGGKLGG